MPSYVRKSKCNTKTCITGNTFLTNSNNISSKMAVSRMIQRRSKRASTFHTSKQQTYQNTIINANYTKNKALLIKLRYKKYYYYFTTVYESSTVPYYRKVEMSKTFREILENITLAE